VVKPRLSVAIIAHDEAADLAACLASVRGLADEVVVADCDSSDGTGAVARRAGARVFRRPNLANIHVNTSFALARCRGDWILNLDPDERISRALAREITHVIRRPRADAAYDMPRRNYYFGRWLRHGAKYPDPVRRLYRRGAARFPNRHVHEKVRVRGRIGSLREALDHHPYPDLAAYLRKLDFYARFQARFLARRGVRPSARLAVRYLAWLPASRFVRRYVFWLGFLDGLPGFLACVHDALTHILTYAHLELD
jgi:glycosyltransferase involved in cell wall biosynthesis